MEGEQACGVPAAFITSWALAGWLYAAGPRARPRSTLCVCANFGLFRASTSPPECHLRTFAYYLAGGSSAIFESFKPKTPRGRPMGHRRAPSTNLFLPLVYTNKAPSPRCQARSASCANHNLPSGGVFIYLPSGAISPPPEEPCVSEMKY